MKKFLFSILFYSALHVTTAQVYVNASATGANNGTSWADAYTDLHTATFNTTSGEIWVAAGTYTPSKSFTGNIPANATQKTFRIQYNVQVYGGFNGTETSLSQRNWMTNPTILSGDQGGGIKSFNVVRFDGNNNTSILDGFTVTNGQATGTTEQFGGAIFMNNSSPIIRNCTFTNNSAQQHGGAVYSVGGAPDFISCKFKNNSTVLYDAGALYVTNGSATHITNCLFDANTAARYAGAVVIQNITTSEVNNCTFVKNQRGTNTGKALFLSQSSGAVSMTVNNCIFYGNLPNTGDDVNRNGTSSYTVNNCYSDGSTLGFSNSGAQTNVLTGPIYFNDFINGDYTLQCKSPAVNSGNAGSLTLPTNDLNGDPRIYNSSIDMGAFENNINTVGIDANKTSICLGDYVVLKGLCDPTGYTWSGGVTDGTAFYPSTTQTYTCTGIGTGDIDSITIFVTNIQNESLSAPSTVCTGSNANVTLASSSAGAQYFLRDNSTNVIVDGPVNGTGSSINFNTGNLYTNNTFNVIGTTSPNLSQNTHTALDFDGSNDILTTSYHFPQTSHLTLEAWIYPRATSYKRIMTSFNGSSVNASTLSFDTYSSLNNGTGLRLVIGGSYAATVDNVLTLNAWNHVAAVYNNSNIKLYVDGIEVGSFVAPSVLLNNAVNTLTIGEDFPVGSAAEYFNGKMDEIRVWNRSLTQTEIQDNMHKKLTGNEDSLHVYFTLDDSGDGTATDFSGNGYHGTMANMATNDWVNSEVDLGNVINNTSFGHALDFDGTDDKVVTSFKMPATGTFSIESWVYPRSSNYDRIISNYDGVGSASAGEIAIDTYDGTINNGRAIRFTVASAVIGAPNALTLNAWNHVACVFNNGSMSIYVNGFEVITGSSAATSLAAITAPINFGEDNVIGTNNEYLNGKLDEVRFWNKALTQTDILNSMNSCLLGTETDLLAYYNFEEGSGTFVLDKTASENLGIMQQMDASTDWVDGVFSCDLSCNLEMTQTVTINVSSVDPSTSTTFNSISSNQSGATYQWLDCNNSYAAISGETSQSFMPLANGSYAVQVTLNGCTDTSACVTYNGVSLNEVSAADFKVYPNPTKNNISIQSQHAIESVEVLNVLGQSLLTSNSTTVALNEFEQGVYYLKINTEKGSVIKKIMKE